MTKRTVLRMIAACRAEGLPVVLGGPEPPYYAERYLEAGADVVVVGEGERTLEELLPRLGDPPEHRDLSGVAGLVYRDAEGRVVRTPPRALIADLDAQPLPDRDAIELQPYLDAWRSPPRTRLAVAAHRAGLPVHLPLVQPLRVRRDPPPPLGRARWPTRRSSSWSAGGPTGSGTWTTCSPSTAASCWPTPTRWRGAACGVPFECISRADRIDAAVADALGGWAASGCGSAARAARQRVLDAMDRRVTWSRSRRPPACCSANTIEVGMFIMLGYPGEDETTSRRRSTISRRTAPDVFLTTVAYPIKGTPYHDEATVPLREPGAWSEWSDRDLVPRGRPTRLYYRFARQWMEGEVARDRHWRARRYLRAAGGGHAGRRGTAGHGAAAGTEGGMSATAPPRLRGRAATRGSGIRLGAEVGSRAAGAGHVGPAGRGPGRGGVRRVRRRLQRGRDPGRAGRAGAAADRVARAGGGHASRLRAMVRARVVLTAALLARGGRWPPSSSGAGWPGCCAAFVLYFGLAGWSEFLGVALRARASPAEALVLLALRAAALGAVVGGGLAGGVPARRWPGCWRRPPSCRCCWEPRCRFARTGPDSVAPPASVGQVLRASLPLAVNGGAGPARAARGVAGVFWATRAVGGRPVRRGAEGRGGAQRRAGRDQRGRHARAHARGHAQAAGTPCGRARRPRWRCWPCRRRPAWRCWRRARSPCSGRTTWRRRRRSACWPSRWWRCS